MAATVERTLSNGTTIQLELEPVRQGIVRIRKYRRKREGDERWSRRKEEEGVTVPWEQLHLEEPWTEVFGMFGAPA